MDHISRIICLGATIVALLVVSQAARANLILNGSLENGEAHDESGDPGNNFMLLHAGSTTDLTNWTVGPDTVAYYWKNDSAEAEQGSRWLSFSNPTPTSEPYGAVSVSQSFSVLAGATYTVTYYEKKRAETGNKIIADILFAAGSATGTLTQTAQNESTTVWQLFTFSFKPDTDTTATIRFSGGGTLNAGSANHFYGAGLDNIDVEQTGPAPEPASLSLLAIGALLTLRRRR